MQPTPPHYNLFVDSIMRIFVRGQSSAGSSEFTGKKIGAKDKISHIQRLTGRRMCWDDRQGAMSRSNCLSRETQKCLEASLTG